MNLPNPNNLRTSIVNIMPPLSHLECMKCGRTEPVGSVGDKLANGWPRCCGYTMRLFTQREVEAMREGTR